MKLTAAAVVTLLHQSSAFAPAPFTRSTTATTTIKRTTTTAQHPRSKNTFARRAIIDPSILADIHHHTDALSNIFSSIIVADGGVGGDIAEPIAAAADAVSSAVSAAADAVSAAAPAVVEAVAPAAPTAADAVTAAAPAAVEAVTSAASSTAVAPAAADAAAAAAKTDDGWFGFLAGPISYIIQAIHGLLSAVGVSENSWGLSIIAMTVLIKIVTYPLTAKQLESNVKLQAFQPAIKEIQNKYQSNPEVMNQKMAALYQDNNFSPLDGCIPALVQIPVFIGLYRAVLTLANEDKLNQSFLWLPNLEGPTYGADPATANSWLFSGWVDGVPSLGWDDTLAFLTIPVILIVSQGISMNLMASKDQEQPAFVKFLPLIIGFFSLNVPAALGIYWIANNFITTALTLQIKAGIKPVEFASPASGGASASSSVVDVQSTFTPAPIREKPSGFGASDWGEDGDGVKPITKAAPVDAEIVTKETTTVEPEAVGEPVVASSNKGGGKKKDRKRGKKKRKKN